MRASMVALAIAVSCTPAMAKEVSFTWHVVVLEDWGSAWG
jgi:hypothetical protein